MLLHIIYNYVMSKIEVHLRNFRWILKFQVQDPYFICHVSRMTQGMPVLVYWSVQIIISQQLLGGLPWIYSWYHLMTPTEFEDSLTFPIAPP